MKFVAHPLAVAVALGLVNANTLSTFEEEPAPVTPCVDCDHSEGVSMVDYSADISSSEAEVDALNTQLREALSLLG